MKKTIEITIDTDTGNLTVAESGESAEMAMGEETPSGANPMEQDSAGKDFFDIDSAMEYAKTLLAGDTRETEDQAMASAQKGYGAKPRVGMGRPSVGQVFGEE